jgi:hypothetical protein
MSFKNCRATEYVVVVVVAVQSSFHDIYQATDTITKLYDFSAAFTITTSSITPGLQLEWLLHECDLGNERRNRLGRKPLHILEVPGSISVQSRYSD